MSFGTRALFKWKGKSCPDSEADSCWLDHGDLLVMDGQCQDEFLHCTDPGLEQERINITFRWVKQHVSSCPLLKAGVACCLPTCAQGSSVSVTELVGKGAAWGLLVLLVVIHLGGILSFADLPSCVCGTWAAQACLSLDTLFGRSSERHCLRGSLGVHQITGNCTTIRDGIICSTGCCWKLLFLLVLVRLPSLHDNYAYTVSWNEGALWGTCRQTHSKTIFPLFGVFSFVGTLFTGSGVLSCGIFG